VISKSINPKLILTVRHYNVRVGSKPALTAPKCGFRNTPAKKRWCVHPQP
jgi:hypothetical protein